MTIRYLFCITPGRSGSDYLAGLLAHARNTVSVHEGVPVMNGRPMRRFNDGDDRELRALLPAKLRAIRRRARPGHVYCETNHSFVKGWGYLLPDAVLPQTTSAWSSSAATRTRWRTACCGSTTSPGGPSGGGPGT